MLVVAIDSGSQTPTRKTARGMARDCVGSIIASQVAGYRYHQMFDQLDERYARIMADPIFLLTAHNFIFENPSEELRLIGMKIYNLLQSCNGQPVALLPPKGMILDPVRIWRAFFGLYRSWLKRTFPQKAGALLAPYL